MMIFSKDMDIVRLIPTMIALYLASLLEAGKSRHMACSIISPVGDLSCSPRLALVCPEAPSTFSCLYEKVDGTQLCMNTFMMK